MRTMLERSLENALAPKILQYNKKPWGDMNVECAHKQVLSLSKDAFLG